MSAVESHCHGHSHNHEAPPKVRVQLPTWFVPVEYDLTLHPDVNGAPHYRFDGELKLTADVLESGQKTITLHSKELAILSASVSSGESSAEVAATCIAFDTERSTVALTFPSEIAKGRVVVNISFIGVHNDQMAGFYRSSYKDANGETKIMVSTQFEALDARRCFPCVDEPAVKAVFVATLVADAHLTLLSNQPESKSTILPGGKKKSVSFLPSPKMSTYLLAFAVGEFDFIQARTNNGVLVRVFAPPTKASLGEFALDVACKTLDFYDDFFGTPYPLPKCDMIAIPEFAMGAMENWGLITYREVEVLIAKDAGAEQKQRVCTVITHELAHQWFGNLVTMKWWDGLWLNEGFASFMQTFAADYCFPEWNVWGSFVTDDQAGALALDALATSHPVQVPIGHAEEVEEVFDAISYHKGACVVKLIHAYLGADAFKAGLQLYMKRHAYGGTETSDLWQAWQDVVGSSKPVAAVMHSWVDQMGFPYVTVSDVAVSNGRVSFKASQRWFLADGSKPPGYETKSWSIPLLVSFGVAGAKGEEVNSYCVNAGLLQGLEAQTFEMPAPAGASSVTWLKLNADQHVPMRVAYDASTLQGLARASGTKAVKPEDRAGLILDAFALAKAGLADPGQVLTLLHAFKEEDNMAVWEAIEIVLGGLDNVLRGAEGLDKAYRKFAHDLVAKRAETLGWEAKAGDDHLATLSRAILVRLRARFLLPEHDAEAVALAKAKFAAYIKKPLDGGIPADLKTPLFRIALAHGDSSDLTALLATTKVLETVSQLKDVYASSGYAPSIEDKERVLKWTLSGELKLQDFFYPMASVASSGSQGAELAFKFMRENFAKIQTMLKSASPSLIMGVISYCCSGFASAERAAEIEAFFVANPVPLAARKVAQIVENTKANAAFLHKIRASKAFADVLKV